MKKRSSPRAAAGKPITQGISPVLAVVLLVAVAVVAAIAVWFLVRNLAGE